MSVVGYSLQMHSAPALANVRKHAQAGKVAINLTDGFFGDANYACIEIADDGVGFQEQESERSFGLQTMRERAASVHGELEISSSPGRGTCVSCRLPRLEDEKPVRSKVIS